MNRHLGSTLYFARHYDEALYYLRRAGEMEPARAGLVRNWMAWTYEAKGVQDQAVQDDLAAAGEDPSREDPGSLRFIYRHDGWKAYWQARIGQMQSGRGSCTPYFLAAAYLRVGDNDSAFTKLNDAVDRKCLWVILLKVDPLMDAARKDGRYGPLLRRVNLSNP
jgi:tetratricopeptide (TPR) repeat protein